MTRLIDAEITAKALEEYLRINRAPMHYQNQFWCEGMEDAERIVSEQPTVDAVEVIRCKDCKFFELDHFDIVSNVPIITAHEICTRWGDEYKTSIDGYCFLAERKDNDR